MSAVPTAGGTHPHHWRPWPTTWSRGAYLALCLTGVILLSLLYWQRFSHIRERVLDFTSLVAGVDSETLPMVIYTMARKGVNPSVNAVSALIVVLLGFLILAAERIQQREP